MDDSICAVDECEKPLFARGWCSTHYTRWKRHGDANYRTRGEVRDGKRICPVCKMDKLVDAYSPGSAYCRPCVAARKRSRPRAEVTPQPCVFCVECGKEFSPRTMYIICCSKQCTQSRKRRFDRGYMAVRDRELANESGRRWYQANREIAFDSSARYRARKAAAFVEEVDRIVVFDRDGWVCQLCDLPLDRDARFPDPLTPSVDHRIPLKLGGAHSYANCQAAHLGCNVQKGARLVS